MMTYLSASRARGSNYTPRDILLQLARERPLLVKAVHGQHGELLLLIQGDLFAYDHWIITRTLSPGLESVTLCLKGVDKT